MSNSCAIPVGSPHSVDGLEPLKVDHSYHLVYANQDEPNVHPWNWPDYSNHQVVNESLHPFFSRQWDGGLTQPMMTTMLQAMVLLYLVFPFIT